MTEAQRKPRFERTSLEKQVTITPRDFEILKAVYDFRLLKTDQVQKMIEGSNQVISRRMRFLFDEGLIARPKAQIRYFTPDNQAIVSGITNKGAKLLVDIGYVSAGRLEWDKKNNQVGQLFIDHTTLIADIVIAFILDCKSKGLRFISPKEILEKSPQGLEFNAKATFYWDIKTEKEEQKIFPDYAFGIEYEDGLKSYFFLEADMGSMPISRSKTKQSSYGAKIDAYRLTYANNIHQSRYGIKNFRVLTVTVSEGRAKNMAKEVLLRTDGHGSNMFLFANNAEEFFASPLTYDFITGKNGNLRLVSN